MRRRRKMRRRRRKSAGNKEKKEKGRVRRKMRRRGGELKRVGGGGKSGGGVIRGFGTGSRNPTGSRNLNWLPELFPEPKLVSGNYTGSRSGFLEYNLTPGTFF